MNNMIYIASRKKDGGIYKYQYENGKGYIEKSFTPLDSPMYMILADKKMHILLRAPFKNSQSGYLNCKISDRGDLYNPSEIITTAGEIACHLTKYKESICCVNYTSGDVTKIGEYTVNHNGKDLPGSHPHYIGATPDNQYLCVADLGQDLIYIYDEHLNCVNKIKMPVGHGVRHLIFSKDARFVFTANELKSTVSVLAYCDGDMRLVDTKSCLPQDYCGDSFASAIRVYNNNIYVANRGHNSISRLSFDGKMLSLIDCFDCKGKTPRDFIFHGNRILCANQDSNNVTVYEEKENGHFEFIQQINIDEPICIACEEES